MAMEEKTYILTAELDDDSFTWLDGLRRLHFPSARNFLSAHLTMFHRLSSDQVERLAAMTMPSQPIDLGFDSLRFLGAGVAFNVRAPALQNLRDDIARTIGGELSRQDGQKWQPHVTVQNKATADIAKTLFATLTGTFSGCQGYATGLLVWEYLGGPWKLIRRMPFGTQAELPAG